MKEANVGITRCTTYIQQDVYNAVKTACENTLFPDVINKYILIKPNILSDAKVQDCITTNPEVIRSVIRLLKEKGASKIIVGDSPGLQGQNFIPKNCGISQICEEENVEFVDFTTKHSIRKLSGTRYKVALTDYAFEVDMIFSVCKFKTHMLMYATGAVKNLFGLVPGLNKSKCHLSNPNRQSFSKLIVGIHETVKPAFSIMDAVIGMEGAGPANGKPKAVNLILASESAFALDYSQAIIMGYNPFDLPILNEAKVKGLLPKKINYPLLKAEDLVINNFETVKITKKTKFIKTLIIPFFTRNWQKRKQLNEPGPIFDKLKCIRCKRCINICPAKALSLKDNNVTINYSKCIRCYCCHEMCPVEAITIPSKVSKDD